MPGSERERLLELLGGSPSEFDRQLLEFAAAASVLSSDQPRLIDTHPLQWVGVYQGRVVASARNMKSLMAQLEKKETFARVPSS